MKPDGTHTKEEILELIQNELQPWERDEICTTLLKDCSDGQLSDFFSRYTPEYISTITGYYVLDEKPEKEKKIEDFMLYEIINDLMDKLYFLTKDRDRLLEAIENNKQF